MVYVSVMKINKALLSDNNIMYGNNSAKERLKSGFIHQSSEEKFDIQQNRPAERASLSGSEHLSGNNKDTVSFTGDPKLVTNIAREALDATKQMDIPKWADKMGAAKWFESVIKSVHKNETFYEAVAALVVAGMLKPICVLAMPGAEMEDKQMSATKNAVSALIGFGLSNLILSPFSNGVNRVNDSLKGKNPTQYIKNTNLIDALKSEELITTASGKQLKSTLGDAFTVAYKKIADIGVSPLKASLTIALTPVVLNALFGKNTKKKKEEQKPQGNAALDHMAVMNSIRLDSNRKPKESAAPSFTGNIEMQDSSPSFKGGVSQVIELTKEIAPESKNIFAKAKGAYCDFLGEPIAKLIGKVAPTKAGQKIVETTARFEKPTARWSDLASVAITFFYINNTRKSEKIDEDRKLPLMINNFMVTVASSTAAFLIDKYTDKPMENILRSYLRAHEAELHDASNKNIKNVLNNVLSGVKDCDADDIKNLMRHSDDMLKGGVENMTQNLKDAIKALSNDGVVKEAIKKGLIKQEDIAKMAAAGFEKQAATIYKDITKTKSLTVFTLTVRFLVTVLMTPIIGKVVDKVNKKLGRGKYAEDKNKQQNANVPPPGSETLGMKDFMKGISNTKA